MKLMNGQDMYEAREAVKRLTAAGLPVYPYREKLKEKFLLTAMGENIIFCSVEALVYLGEKKYV